LQAGARPEEIDAARATLARLNEELDYLEELQNKVLLISPVAGVVITPRLKEKVGQYVSEGELIAIVEEPDELELEIGVAEEDVARVEPGQRVEIKARALPFETFATKVDRVAPAAARGDVQSRVTVYCRLEQAPTELRSEMSGYARIYTGRRPLGAVFFDRVWRLLRTEFWW
jgi:putative peptide zinc metalloprotease protein